MTELPTERFDFPEGFIWGTAAAAHQAEGGNWNNDWWAWEHDPRTTCVEPSGDAIDHYNRFDEDFALLASYGHDAHRFSIEWSRVEPEEGQFSTVELEHYKRVLDSLHYHGLVPFMTLHHFSSPRWLAKDGGWSNPKVVDRFRRFADVVAKHMGDRAPYVCTINEPQIVALMGYQSEVFPPGLGDKTLFWPTTRNFVAAHQAALEAYKSQIPDTKVGITLAVSDFQAANEAAEPLRDRIHHRMVQTYYDAIRTGWVRGPSLEEEIAGLSPETNDFVGVQFYSRSVIGTDGQQRPPEGAETTQMGYEVVPDSFVTVLKNASDAGVPVFVTENGIGTADDTQRVRYIATHLQSCKRAMDAGVDLRGYIYWCAIDNFEWALGYRPTFGLIACDRTTFERIPKRSADYYGEICRTNAVDPHMTAKFFDA